MGLKQSTPKVSIIISSYNQYNDTKNCIKSVLDNANGVDYEIILADDFSADETKNLAKKISEIKFIRNRKKLGYVKTINKAAKLASGEYICLLDSDITLSKNWLSSMLNIIEKDKSIGLIGPIIAHLDGSETESGFLIDSYGEFSIGKSELVDFCSDYCLLIRKDVWDKIGGFSTQFEGIGFADADFALKVKSNLNFNCVCDRNVKVNKAFSSDYKEIKYTECKNLRFYLKWKKEIQKNLDKDKKGIKINICFGLNDNFAQHAGVVIASILANSTMKDDYHIYIISDYVSAKNKKNIEKLKEIRDFEITYLKVSNKDFKGIRLNNLGFSTLYRFKIFDFIKDEKILYLDSDIIVLKDLRELFKTDISGYLAAGVEDILSPKMKKIFSMDETSTYINAGVILFNLKKCREEGLNADLIKTANKIKSKQQDRIINDQDVLNVIMQNKIKLLDYKWNCMYKFDNFYKDKEAYSIAAVDPGIVHYIIYKPWNTDCKNDFKRLEYFGYLKLTQWYTDFMCKFAEKTIFSI